jgi:hypothetical protein
VVPIWPAAFFPPGLHPVLDGGEGDKDTVIAPQVPAGGLIWQAILDDESHGEGDDTMGVARSGQGVFGCVRIEELLAASAAVLRILQVDFAGATDNEVAQVMQYSGVYALPKARLATARTRTMGEVATPPNNLRCRQIGWVRDALGRVG